MAVDKNKVTAEATRLVQKGAYDKAIKAYEKILAADPKDVRVLLKVGELQQKKGDNPSAAATFGRAADAYSDQGFFLKAVAVLKQMMKLSPDDVRVNERLAGLYAQLGILSDAMAQLQLVAQAAERGGDAVKLLEVVRRMVELEPDNVASSVKLGELEARAGQPKVALELFRRAAEALKRNNRMDEYVKVGERIVVLEPGDVALTRELAHLYLAKGDTKHALVKLQLCFKANPKDIDTLTLLAQAFKDLGQTAKTISVYKELAQLHAEHGRADEVRAAWRRVLELSPEDPEATQALAAVKLRAPATPPAMSARPPAAAAPPAGAKGPGPEAIPKLLTETDVYVKYGLHEKALEHLQKVFAIDPDHLEAREKALQLRAARNDAAGAAEEAVKVARLALARGLDDRARAAVARLRELAPSHPALGTLDVDAVPAPADADVIELGPDEVEVDIDVQGGVADDEVALTAAESHGEEVVEDEGLGTLEPSPPPPPVAPPPIAARRTAVVAPPIITPPPNITPPPAARPLIAAPPPLPRPEPEGPVLVLGPPRAEPTLSTALPPAAPTLSPTLPLEGGGSVGAAPPPPPKPEQDEADLDDEIEEAQFFIQQRLFDEAREVLSRLLVFHPGHAKVAGKLAELERVAAASPIDSGGAQPPNAQPPGVDLARELAEVVAAAPSTNADDASQYSVEDVFSQFKKQVEQTVQVEDADTHYDLGIAYKEMGLLDDAIHEFEVALAGKGRKREIDGLTMVGFCRMEKHDFEGAIEAYRRALRSDLLTAEAARAIQYDLAAAYAAKGEPEFALHYLHKVLKVDPRYRDAKALVDRLGGGPGRAPPPDAATSAAGNASGAAAGQGHGPKKNIGYV